MRIQHPQTSIRILRYVYRPAKAAERQRSGRKVVLFERTDYMVINWMELAANIPERVSEDGFSRQTPGRGGESVGGIVLPGEFFLIPGLRLPHHSNKLFGVQARSLFLCLQSLPASPYSQRDELGSVSTKLA